MKVCKIPPIDSLEDRGFWITSIGHIQGITQYKVNAVYGCGLPKEQAFIVIRSKATGDDLAVYSIEKEPKLIWGMSIPDEEIVKSIIQTYLKVLIDHWMGNNDSLDLAREFEEKK
jgi:hypothetical protein